MLRRGLMLLAPAGGAAAAACAAAAAAGPSPPTTTWPSMSPSADGAVVCAVKSGAREVLGVTGTLNYQQPGVTHVETRRDKEGSDAPLVGAAWAPTQVRKTACAVFAFGLALLPGPLGPRRSAELDVQYVLLSQAPLASGLRIRGLNDALCFCQAVPLLSGEARGTWESSSHQSPEAQRLKALPQALPSHVPFTRPPPLPYQVFFASGRHRPNLTLDRAGFQLLSEEEHPAPEMAAAGAPKTDAAGAPETAAGAGYRVRGEDLYCEQAVVGAYYRECEEIVKQASAAQYAKVSVPLLPSQ
jgi:hypothetical protein